MRPMTLAALAATGTLTALAAPTVAYANPTHTPKCATIVHDHINKPDNGHGTPPEWADLSLTRDTSIQCTGPGKYEVLLVDSGTLKTRTGAGTPNGSGGTIAHTVPGRVEGVYGLAIEGRLSIPMPRRDTSLSSTAYVMSLFAPGATVVRSQYAWTYTTPCGERWLDASTNNDGQGMQAGNITGKTCRPRHRPRQTPTPMPTGTTPAKPGEAPVPTPVHSDLPVTG